MVESTSKESLSSLLEKLSRTCGTAGITSLLQEPENPAHPMLIPRQRFLKAIVTDSQVLDSLNSIIICILCNSVLKLADFFAHR